MQPDRRPDTGGRARVALLAALALSGCTGFAPKQTNEEWLVVDGCVVQVTGKNIDIFLKERLINIGDDCTVTLQNTTGGTQDESE